MSMAHSLEVRAPLLDTPLVEIVLRLPDVIKLSHRNGPKPLLSAAGGCIGRGCGRWRRWGLPFHLAFDM